LSPLVLYCGVVLVNVRQLIKRPYKRAIVSLSGYFRGNIPADSDTLVIGVDRGTHHLLEEGIMPHIVIGDLDSISRMDLISTLRGKSVPYFLVSNWDKDYTDGQRAIEIVYTVGIKHLTIIGIMGGEMDHFLGNLSLFSMYSHMFDTMVGYTGYQTIELVEGQKTYALPKGTSISFVPYDDEVTLTLRGVLWEVENRLFKRENLPPISNIVVKDNVVIDSDGKLWVIIGREDKPYLLKYPQGR